MNKAYSHTAKGHHRWLKTDSEIVEFQYLDSTPLTHARISKNTSSVAILGGHEPYRLSLRPQIVVKEPLDRCVGMSPVALPCESVLGTGVHHDIEGLAQILQLAKQLGAV
jgi:hypothetical protein